MALSDKDRIAALEKRIGELEAEVSSLRFAGGTHHHHHHYPRPVQWYPHTHSPYTYPYTVWSSGGITTTGGAHTHGVINAVSTSSGFTN